MSFKSRLIQKIKVLTFIIVGFIEKTTENIIQNIRNISNYLIYTTFIISTKIINFLSNKNARKNSE